ncbi:MAG TPA: LysR family transcriptional regulator [Halieaceae bacterium]|jgi:LysR family transcriptional activator of nhaA|uniref:LysR family transcriptional regulator n=1 Tax=Haliea sp. TaxID=1932666 RepID=UPI000C3F393C|nr:LysR family transcriptional regulator [Haliea sp.]HAN68610.1 LysR family transcriptional regulator [Halieaceae bacterium]MAD65292.1 LysR family transcriptional regulator [Haliea sp.]MAY94025.1 LysR family transcriptional regulator [Haliea sp.]MBK40710.1 LysR family transcriptional regulator [Haliea sp.]MBP69397.1 LysR family transcriptional regulator [Haliea sp.]|tara:strand:+ start:4196 stop:5116 length:921 start_codon:yes stop_codon:yes gene_type:complete
MRQLNFHHLYYFWVVAKEGHLTRAAQQLHVSQSALSSQIKQLQEQLGHELFSRDGRSLRLTEVGHLVLEYAESIFNLGSELLALTESGELQRVQRLRIGSVATLSRNFQENFLRPVIGEAKVKLVIRSASLEELLEQLRVHKLDLILSNRAVAADTSTPWRCQQIAEQSVCIVGPPGKPAKQFRFPHDLGTLPLLLPGPNSEIRNQFDLLCEQHGVEVDPYAEVEDMAMLRLLARDSGGLAVVPEVVVQDELQSGKLERYCVLDSIVERFYAITAKRHFELVTLNTLLEQYQDGARKPARRRKPGK